jgi:hypothetical protein
VWPLQCGLCTQLTTTHPSLTCSVPPVTTVGADPGRSLSGQAQAGDVTRTSLPEGHSPPSQRLCLVPSWWHEVWRLPHRCDRL